MNCIRIMRFLLLIKSTITIYVHAFDYFQEKVRLLREEKDEKRRF